MVIYHDLPMNSMVIFTSGYICMFTSGLLMVDNGYNYGC